LQVQPTGQEVTSINRGIDSSRGNIGGAIRIVAPADSGTIVLQEAGVVIPSGKPTWKKELIIVTDGVIIHVVIL